jgi:hypothetical protein
MSYVRVVRVHAGHRMKSAQTTGSVRQRTGRGHLFSGCRQPVSADPERPRLDAVESEDAVHPRIIREHRTCIILAGRAHDEHRVLPVDVADRSAERDRAVLGESIDERGMLVPAGLLAATTRWIPRRPARVPDQEIASHADRVMRSETPADLPADGRKHARTHAAACALLPNVVRPRRACSCRAMA